MFQSHDNKQDTNIFKIFQVLIGNSKCVEIFKFYNDAPMLKYRQKSLNSYCFSILASEFDIIEETRDTNAIPLRIEEFVLILEMLTGKTKKKLKGKPRVYYSPRKYKNMGSYDIMTDISEHINIFQLMDYLGNANHDISVIGYWIFDSN